MGKPVGKNVWSNFVWSNGTSYRGAKNFNDFLGELVDQDFPDPLFYRGNHSQATFEKANVCEVYLQKISKQFVFCKNFN